LHFHSFSACINHWKHSIINVVDIARGGAFDMFSIPDFQKKVQRKRTLLSTLLTGALAVPLATLFATIGTCGTTGAYTVLPKAPSAAPGLEDEEEGRYPFFR
jgi:hypothetical protein